MEHHLEESLNLESTMRVDFDQPEETVCHQSDIILDNAVQEDIQMEFEHTEEQPILMDTGSEEIIISDLIGGQFNLQDLQNDQSDLPVLSQPEQTYNVVTQSDTMLDLQLNPQIVTTATDQPQKRVIRVQTSPKKTVTSIPRQVAIAPKPPNFIKTAQGKQFAIAPKPVSLIANKNMIKKMSIANTVHGSNAGKAVLAHIGKQIVMVPTNAQKIKLVSASQSNVTSLQQLVRSDGSQAQILPSKLANVTQGKPMKLIALQGQPNVDLNSPAMITKLVPAGGKMQQARYVTVQTHKSMPLAVGNKVIMASPTKQGVKYAKKQEMIAIKPMPMLLPKGATPVSTANKVVVNANPSQNVILKTTAPTTQAVKDNPAEPSRTQIHQINVPGKGIQYIRLVTNSSSAPAKAVLKQPQKLITVPSKGNLMMLADNKGVVIKSQPKLVRIAPVGKIPIPVTQPSRSSQSLLAPISPNKTLIEMSEDNQPHIYSDAQEAEIDSKEALRALIENSMGDDAGVNHESSEEENTADSMDQMDSSVRSEEHPLIVIPSNFEHIVEVQSDYNKSTESENSISMIKREQDSMNTFESMNNEQSYSEHELEATDLGLRPRKACNCTKSQCLKLYCDCFANGEFCNQCNCNNCHNNLENEELRQKAIRGCLDRNPHAFKPKIGKTKAGGPDIVRRHNKGCNCKRSGCLKNYCECYEARIACTAMCKCVGCRNVTDCLEHGRLERQRAPPPAARALAADKQPCSFMTSEVIEAVCQCLVAAAAEGEGVPGGRGGDGVAGGRGEDADEPDPVRDVIEEFARCLQDIISASQYTQQEEGLA
ncbi:protein lin-54 homolog isoform X2 [Zerene cesonia]|uniref:protein lin-54 homolog isoform X2 n=1 Tax=Zerene cesonia TaxID=33412 RepID=UPI0018E56058|nr:protein lin-54 homolog isoform X2 [Zerene cesonia]